MKIARPCSAAALLAVLALTACGTDSADQAAAGAPASTPASAPAGDAPTSGSAEAPPGAGLEDLEQFRLDAGWGTGRRVASDPTPIPVCGSQTVTLTGSLHRGLKLVQGQEFYHLRDIYFYEHGAAAEADLERITSGYCKRGPGDETGTFEAGGTGDEEGFTIARWSTSSNHVHTTLINRVGSYIVVSDTNLVPESLSQVDGPGDPESVAIEQAMADQKSMRPLFDQIAAHEAAPR